MAGFREIPSPKSGLFCVVVLLVLFILSLLINFHSGILVSDSTYVYGYQKPDLGKGQGRNTSSHSTFSGLEIVPNPVLLYTNDNITAAKFWKGIDAMITNDSLYSEDFDVSLVVNVLRHAKIIKADLFLERSSYKWNLDLQGGQRIVFKPKIV